MNTLTKLNATSTLTNAQLSRFSATQLSRIAQYTPGVTDFSGFTVEMKTLVESVKPWSFADNAAVLSYQRSVALGTILHIGHLETSIANSGASVLYEPTKATITYLDGTKAEVRNSPFPRPLDKHDRVGMDDILAVVVSLFDIDAGVLVQIATTESWDARCTFPGSPINTGGIMMVKEALNEILYKSGEYATVRSLSRTVKGKEFDRMIHDVLANCPIDEYLALHTITIRKFLKFIVEGERNGEKQFFRQNYVNEHGKSVLVIPEGSITRVAVTAENKSACEKIQAAMGHPPLILRNSIPCPMKWYSPTNCDLKSAHKAYMDGQAFRGGKKRGAGFMLATMGFSFMQSPEVRRQTTLLSIAFALLERGELVDINVKICDIVPILNSLKVFFPDSKGAGRYRLIVGSGDILKAGGHAVVSTSCRADAVFVAWGLNGLPSVASHANITEVFEKDAGMKMGAISAKKYVVVENVTGDIFWTGGCKVYQFRDPYDFGCIVSNYPGLSYCYSNDGKTLEMKHYQDIPAFPDLWRKVIISNGAMNTYVLCPRVFFNPISNLLKYPARGYKVELNTHNELQFTQVAGFSEDLPPDSQLNGTVFSFDTGQRVQFRPDVPVTTAGGGGGVSSSSSSSSGLSGVTVVSVPEVVAPGQEVMNFSDMPLS